MWDKLILTALILSHSQESWSLNLDTFVQEALYNNNLIKSSSLRKQAARSDKKSKFGLFLPSVTLDANKSWNESTTEGNNRTQDFSEDYNSDSYGVTVSQRLLDLESYYTYKASSITESLETLSQKRTKQSLINDTVDSYFSYLKVLAQIRATEQEEKSAYKRYYQIKKNFERGNISKTDLYEAKSQLGRVKNELVDLRKDLSVEHSRLRDLTRTTKKPSHDINLKDISIRIDDESFTQWKSNISSYNLDTQIADLRYKNSKALAKRDRSRMVPKVSANINYNHSYSDNNESTTSPFNGHENATVYGLTFTMPLFTGGQNYFGYKSSNYNSKSLFEDYLSSVSLAEFDLENVIFQINSEVESLEYLKDIIQSNHESFKGIKKAYEMGTRTITDVLSSEQLLYDSVRDYYDSKYDYYINLVNLRFILGDLTEETITDVSRKLLPSSQAQNFQILFSKSKM